MPPRRRRSAVAPVQAPLLFSYSRLPDDLVVAIFSHLATEER